MSIDDKLSRGFEELLNETGKDAYEVIGIPSDRPEGSITKEEIIEAYHRSVAAVHPDSYPNANRTEKKRLNEETARVNRAYAFLEKHRGDYNKWLSEKRATNANAQQAPNTHSYSQRQSPQQPRQEAQSRKPEGTGSRVYANGVELPIEFGEKRTIINIEDLLAVILSDDGSKYATVNGGVQVYDTPRNGWINPPGAEGVNIRYHRGRNPRVEVSSEHGTWFDHVYSSTTTSAGGTISIGRNGSISNYGGRVSLEDLFNRHGSEHDDPRYPISDPDLRDAVNANARYKRAKAEVAAALKAQAERQGGQK